MKTFTLAFGQKNPPKKITSSSSGKEDDECLIKKMHDYIQQRRFHLIKAFTRP